MRLLLKSCRQLRRRCMSRGSTVASVLGSIVVNAALLFTLLSSLQLPFPSLFSKGGAGPQGGGSGGPAVLGGAPPEQPPPVVVVPQRRARVARFLSEPAEEGGLVTGDPHGHSFYRRWIEADLEPWRRSGIRQHVVTELATATYRQCFGEAIRFQVLNGTLWVDHISERHGGWWPASMGEGNLAAKGKIPYAILALMDVLRHYPGQVPDVDAVLQTSDFPCAPRGSGDSGAEGDEDPPGPLLGYNSHPDYADIPFPDYSYWGHEYARLLDNEDGVLHGWGRQSRFLFERWANASLADRTPLLVWRGRTQDADFPGRDELRRRFKGCPGELEAQGLGDLAGLFDVGGSEVSLHDLGDYRFSMYVEAEAWVTNLKQKLAAGSLLVANRMEYYEFFTRALQPGVHYLDVDPADLCRGTATLVQELNGLLDAEGGDRRDKGAFPWRVAAAGQQFLRDHVRMADVRLYIRDVLREYGRLQRFQPHQSWNAECYTGERLLEEFGYPHAFDRGVVAQAYPWLEGYGQAACRGRLPRRDTETDELYVA